jgi:hypothetical protein
MSPDETKRIDAEYGDYRRGWDKQRSEHLNKQFVERHPKTGLALTVGGPVASAVATRGIFGKVNKMGEEIVTAGNAARASDDMRALADSIVRADRYATYAPVAKVATAAKASAIPTELRMTADIIDKKALLPDSGARKAAEERMADLPNYGKGMGFDLLSGAIGTGTGSLWSKWRTPSPGVDLHALRNHAAGIPRGGFPEYFRGPRISQDQLSQALTERAIKAVEAERALAAARGGLSPGHPNTGGIPSSGPGPGIPTPAGVPAGGASAPPGSSPLAELLQQAPAQGQRQLPVTVPNPQTLSPPANRNVPKRSDAVPGVDKLNRPYHKDPDDGRFISKPPKDEK